MAVFYFNQKKTQEIKIAITMMPPESKVWFQPTNNGGCLQVIKMKDDSKTETIYREDIFVSKRNNYKQFIRKLNLIQDCIELNTEWIQIIIRADKIRFVVTITNDKIKHKLISIKKKSSANEE